MEDRLAKIEKRLDSFIKLIGMLEERIDKSNKLSSFNYKDINERMDRIEALEFWLNGDVNSVDEINNYLKQITESIDILNERQVMLGNKLLELVEDVEELKTKQVEEVQEDVDSWEALVRKLK